MLFPEDKRHTFGLVFSPSSQAVRTACLNCGMLTGGWYSKQPCLGREGMKTEGELLEATADCPPVGSWWRHYKGNLYVVEGCCVQEETLTPCVLYRRNGSQIVFSRPLNEWQEAVNKGGEMGTGVFVARYVRYAT